MTRAQRHDWRETASTMDQHAARVTDPEIAQYLRETASMLRSNARHDWFWSTFGWVGSVAMLYVFVAGNWILWLSLDTGADWWFRAGWSVFMIALIVYRHWLDKKLKESRRMRERERNEDD